MPCSAIIREASSRSGQEQTQRPTMNLGMFCPPWVVSIKSLPLRAQGTMLKRRQKECKIQKGGGTPGKQGLLNHQSPCTHELRDCGEHAQGLHGSVTRWGLELKSEVDTCLIPSPEAA